MALLNENLFISFHFADPFCGTEFEILCSVWFRENERKLEFIQALRQLLIRAKAFLSLSTRFFSYFIRNKKISGINVKILAKEDISLIFFFKFFDWKLVVLIGTQFGTLALPLLKCKIYIIVEKGMAEIITNLMIFEILLFLVHLSH